MLQSDRNSKPPVSIVCSQNARTRGRKILAGKFGCGTIEPLHGLEIKNSLCDAKSAKGLGP
jgi:hypothetical protein